MRRSYMKNVVILIALVVAIVVLVETASAAVDASKFNSAVSAELGKAVDMDALYQRANQIYDVLEHDESHIVWKFTGTTGDYALVFGDGRLMVASIANFNLAAKDTLEKELNDEIDMIDVLTGVTDEEREHAVDHAIYYGSVAGVYHRIKYQPDGSFSLKLSVPDCTIKKARLNAENLPPKSSYIMVVYHCDYYLDDELVSCQFN